MKRLFLILATLGGPAFAAEVRAESVPGEALPAPIVERLQAATVFLEATIGPAKRSGWGFLFGREAGTGYVISNYQVVVEPLRSLAPVGGQAFGRLPPREGDIPRHKGGAVQCVFRPGSAEETSVPAPIVALDEDLDLAVLKVDLVPLPDPIDIEASVAPRESLPVFVAGVPSGDMPRTDGRHPAVTVSPGAVGRLLKDEYGRVAAIQITGEVSPGGPVVDAQGRLVGLAVGREAGPQEGMVIPSETLREFLGGRIASVGVDGSIDTGKGVASVSVDVRLTNPMRKIKSVSMHYVRDDAEKEPLTRAPNGLWPRLPGTQTAELKFDGWACAQGAFRFRCLDTADVVFRFQIAHTGADGTPVYSEPGRFTVRREGAGQSRPLPGGPEDTRPRKPVIEFSWRPPPVTPVTPPPETAVSGRLELDSRGRRYTALTAQGVELDLGKDVLQVVACLSGKEVYAIRRGQPAVAVFDPLTWKTVAEIAVPDAPVAIWADTELIAVACDKSRTVVLIDAQKRSPIAWNTLPELRDYRPDAVIGRAPDGSIMSLWGPEHVQNPFEAERLLVHVTPDGQSRILLSVRNNLLWWATWLPDGTGVVIQNSFEGGPAGGLGFLRAGPPLADPQDPLRFQGGELYSEYQRRGVGGLLDHRGFGRAGFHCDTGPAFLTSDRKALVVRRMRIPAEGWANASSGYTPDESIDERYTVDPEADSTRTRLPWTYLLSPSLDRVLGEFPGSAVAELPEQGLFITAGCLGVPPPPTGEPSAPRLTPPYQMVCYYVSSRNSRVVREIMLVGPARDAMRPSAVGPLAPTSKAVFVPGHELLLLPSQSAWFEPVTYTAFRCGPIAASGALPPGGLAPAHDPPATVTVGEEMRYTPTLEPGTALSDFRLRLAPAGMTIDPKTGAVSWRPGREHLGRWSIRILATAGGKEDTLIKWTLEVR